MHVRHADAADNAADDANETLIGTTNKKIVQVRTAVELFFGCAVDRAALVAREAHDRGRREHVGVDHTTAVIGNKPHCRGGHAIVPAEFF